MSSYSKTIVVGILFPKGLLFSGNKLRSRVVWIMEQVKLLKGDHIMFFESSVSMASPLHQAKRNLHHVFFFCDAPRARQVLLAGDFNRGDPTPMRRMADGRWMACLELPHGHHQYVFLVDGKRVLDPNAAGKTRNERNELASLIAVS
jgi:1,4-alpha-glucan branching enzyme